MRKVKAGFLLISAGWVLNLSAAPLTIPAVNFSDREAALEVDDFLSLKESSEVSVAIRVPLEGDHHVVVTARGDEAGATPIRARISVDGQSIGEWSPDSGSTWRTYTFPVRLTEGDRLIGVRCISEDADAQSEGAGALYLHSLTLIQQEEVPGLESLTEEKFRRGQEERRMEVLDEAVKNARAIRHGPVVVQVLDAAGVPVNQAAVTLEAVNPRFKLGTALTGSAFHPDDPINGHVMYKNLAEKNFNEVMPAKAMLWSSMESVADTNTSGVLSAMIGWAEEKGKSIHGHCIFWACPERVQDWVKSLDDDMLTRRIEQRIQSLITSYPQVNEYTVNNEMLACSFYRDRLGTGIRSRMFTLCRDASKTVRLYLNEFDVLNGVKSDECMEHIQDLLAQGAPVGGIGVQAHCEGKLDISSMRRVLDQLAVFELPIKLTELDIQVENEDLQARYLEDVMRVAYGHPAVQGVILSGFWESAHERPQAALYRKDFSPKPAGRVLEKLAAEWKPGYTRDTGPEGLVDDYLVYGKCRVTVQAQGFKKQTIPFDLTASPDGDPKRITVVLEKL